jgi:hypothetical protein
MSRALLMALAIAVFPWTPSLCAVPACVCASAVRPEPYVEASGAVFVGRVLAIHASAMETAAAVYSPDSLPMFMDSVTLIELTSPDCPTRFRLGNRYLVFAEGHEKQFAIGMCTRTSNLETALARSDLDALGPPAYQRL